MAIRAEPASERAATRPEIAVRTATLADNAALVALAESCTMDGDISMRVDRAPDFFALSALEGESWRVGVAVDRETIVGCVAASRRHVWMNGERTIVGYASDFKVHPAYRGTGTADLLARWVTSTIAELCGEDAPTVLTILRGNSRMENRARGPRGAPVLARFATLRVHAIPLLGPRNPWVKGVTVRSATDADIGPMVTLWNRIAPGRQLADVLDVRSLDAWIARAPGLSLADYLLAHDEQGRLRGFVGIWDQTALKTLRITGYSPRLAVVRQAVNAIAPVLGAPRLPAAGGALPVLSAVHCCTAEPRVLRALLLDAYGRHRGGTHALLTIGLDARDPLVAGTRGLLAQPTIINAYVTTAKGSANPTIFDQRPLHFETALV